MPCPSSLSRLACRASAVLLAGWLAGCSTTESTDEPLFAAPETALDYEVVLEGAPSEYVASLMERSLALYRQQEKGAASTAFLRRRAEGDIATAQKILRSRGYYQAEIETDVEAPPEPDPAAAPEEPDPDTDGTPPPVGGERPPERPVAKAVFRITPGPQLTLAQHRLLVVDSGGTLPDPLEAAELGSPVGGPALAAAIVSAEGAAVAKLRREGRPYAKFRNRTAEADLEAGTLEVDSVIAAGPFYTYGEIEISGAPNVDPDFIQSYVPWEDGAVLNTEELKEFQSELFGTSLFSGVRVSPPEAPPLGPAAPVILELEEAPFRTVSLGARYGTDEGAAVRASFEHRNIFGAGERLGLNAELGVEDQIASVTFLKPQIWRPGQNLTAGLELRHIDDNAYQELGTTLTVGLTRELTERWTVGAGGLIEASQIDEGMGEETAVLFGLPLFAAYDSSDDELDATRGQRLRFSVTPFTGVFQDEATNFLTLEARGSAYQDLLGDKRFVLAERGRIGTIVAGERARVPATRRFYSGGGGSVRGYESDLIGPLDAANDPIGGLSVIEAGIELRARIWGDIGGVVFADAGAVSEGRVPDFADGLQVGAGAGLRYYSPIGPVRIDIAVPVNGRDVDDSFQAYLSIGQAF